MHCLYVLEIRPLSVALLAKIFSHSVGCLFIFLMVSFAVQKLLNLFGAHWFLCVFIVIIPGADQTRYFCLFAISWAAPPAYGGSQARGRIRAVAAGLHQSHSNTRSKLHLQPTPQLMAMPDP